VITVTSVADGGAGSLRAAIEEANARGNAVELRFAIGSGTATIRPDSPLPPLAFGGIVDGWTQPGLDDAPLIEVDGAHAPDGGGLEIVGEGLTVRGLALTGWTADGIRVRGADCTIDGVVASGNGRYGVLVDEGAHQARIIGSFIGTDPTGSSAVPNQRSGIRVIQAGRCVIGGPTMAERNVLSGNVQYGLEIVGPEATGAVVLGNHIGTDMVGLSPVPNERTGILVYNVAHTRIGGPGPGDANLISGNMRGGVNVDGSFDDLPEYPYSGLGHCHHNVVEGNLIGVDRTGEAPLGNRLRGVLVNHSQDGTVVDNLISGNGEDGVLVLGPEDHSNPDVIPARNLIIRNRIGVTVSGHACGNGRHGILVRHARTTSIGTDAASDGNTIAFNTRRGVVFSGSGARSNRLGLNDISANTLGDFHQPRS
jgi:hypothetical protein